MHVYAIKECWNQVLVNSANSYTSLAFVTRQITYNIMVNVHVQDWELD